MNAVPVVAPLLPDNADCPRCGQPFRCGAADPSCACFGLTLTAQMQAQLAQDYGRCLCVACLVALQDGPETPKATTAPGDGR